MTNDTVSGAGTITNGHTAVLDLFDKVALANRSLIEQFVSTAQETEALLQDARERMTAMLPNLAYVDNIDHPMAMSLHYTAINLALFLPLQERGVSAHDFGARMLSSLEAQYAQRPPPALTEPGAALRAAAEQPAKPGEFEFEVFDDAGNRYGMNIKSCAVCALFSQHDAMDLVPYMCASDDVMSAAGDQGLQRTGSIGLGAHQCDFVFDKGEPGAPLADQYPELIRFIPSS